MQLTQADLNRTLEKLAAGRKYRTGSPGGGMVPHSVAYRIKRRQGTAGPSYQGSKMLSVMEAEERAKARGKARGEASQKIQQDLAKARAAGAQSRRTEQTKAKIRAAEKGSPLSKAEVERLAGESGAKARGAASVTEKAEKLRHELAMQRQVQAQGAQRSLAKYQHELSQAARRPGWKKMLRRVGIGGAVTLAAGAGITGIGALIDHLRSKSKSSKHFKSMMSENKDLRKNPQDALKRFKTLERLSPEMSSDPIVSGSFVRQALHMKDVGIPIKSIAEIAKARADISRAGGTGEKMRQALTPAISEGLKP